MDTAPKIVLQNPYRILGVYANAAKKDIVANKGKATAFLKVNKPVEYPLDLKGILPAPNRTLDLMNEAEGHLAIAKEQIKYAQFWFLKMTPIDDVAFNHLVAGNMAGAIEIWSKQESLSSLQNKLVCYLIESKLELAVKTAEKLYEKFGNDYISKIDANCTLQMTATDLLHQFVDSLGEEIGMQTMLGFNLGVDTRAYISSQTIGPLINKISSEVDKTKKVDHKDPKARIEAARRLVANTKEPFTQLKKILPATDSQYQMIADKLGLEILQCGIDYFIGLKDKEDDAPFTAMKILKHARTIVVGGLAVGRCDDQIKELKKYIDNQPPKEVAAEIRMINKSIAVFAKGRERRPEDYLVDHDEFAFTPVYTLLKDTETPLSRIREILGQDNELYVKTSTTIARISLNKVIEVVNNAQRLHQDLMFGHGDTNSLKAVLIVAWNLTVKIGDMHVTSEFGTNYQTKKNALKSICKQFGVVLPFEFPSLKNIVGNFKSSESSKWQAALIVQLSGVLIGFLIYYSKQQSLYYEDVEIWPYLAWGTGIGALAWLCMLVDDDSKSGNWGDIVARGGCYGAIMFIGLFLFYWIYKLIRLAIDGVKGA